MTTALIEPLDCRQTANQSPLFDRLATWWDASRGLCRDDEDSFVALMPWVQITLCDQQRDGDFPFIFLGVESTTALLFGRDFCAAAPSLPGLPDRDFETAVMDVYQAVSASGRPDLSVVGAPIVDGNRQKVFIHYRRLVVPIVLPRGQRAVATWTEFLTPPARCA